MGRQTTILQVFVASPNELKDERLALEAVVTELNQTQSESTGAYLELIKWETHSVPGFGSDPQAVINEQIGDNYDIFIGILSTKFGTATPRAGSGTAEEFDRAYERFTKDPSQLRIMFYFKDPQLKASELDLDEYKRVKDFKTKLGEKGLYSTFSTTDDFVSMVRMHLNRQLQDWAPHKWGHHTTTAAAAAGATAPPTTPPPTTPPPTTPSSTTPPPATPISASVGMDDEDELGFLDLVELANDSLHSGAGSLSRIQEAIEDIGSRTNENTQKLNEANAQRDIAKQKQAVNNVARTMEEFSSRLDAELPLFSNSFSTGIDAISRSATLWESDFKSDDKSTIQATHDSLEQLLAGIETTQQSMSEMHDVVVRLPRLASSFNKAKKHAGESLAGLNQALAGAHNLTREALTELKRILDDGGTTI